VGEDRVALLGILQRGRKISCGQIGLGEFVEHDGLAAQQLRIVGVGFGQLLDGLAHLAENLVEALDPEALHVAQALRDLKNQSVNRALGGGEVSLGALRLEFGDDAGRDRANRQPEQETRGRHRQRW
jgi:hypothetical protein